jgi:hypothetical protein
MSQEHYQETRKSVSWNERKPRNKNRGLFICNLKFILRWYIKLVYELVKLNLRSVIWPNYQKYQLSKHSAALAIEDEDLQNELLSLSKYDLAMMMPKV